MNDCNISQKFRYLANNIDDVFQQLIKLILRKTLAPRECDVINKYFYKLAPQSLGWTNINVFTVKVESKVQNCTRNRTAWSKDVGKMQEFRRSPCIRKGYLDLIKQIKCNTLHNMANFRTGTMISAIPFNDAYVPLVSIGRDILVQTEWNITPEESARMSTADLRVALYRLDQFITDIRISMPEMYDNYIRMVKLINDISGTQLNTLYSLIDQLSKHQWCDIPVKVRNLYTTTFGSEWIECFRSNELITILLQSCNGEVIITASYLYPVLKALYFVFYFGEIHPVVSNICEEEVFDICSLGQRQRPDNCDECEERTFCHRTVLEPYEDQDCIDNNDDNDDDCVDEQEQHLGKMSDHVVSDRVFPPINPLVVNNIEEFRRMYPNLTDLMGSELERNYVELKEIPETYEDLCSISEYLKRYQNYAWANYVEYRDRTIMSGMINCEKVSYLVN